MLAAAGLRAWLAAATAPMPAAWRFLGVAVGALSVLALSALAQVFLGAPALPPTLPILAFGIAGFVFVMIERLSPAVRARKRRTDTEAKRNARMRERLAVLDRLLSATPTRLFLIDRDARFVYASPAGLAKIAVPAEVLLGNGLEALGLPPESVPGHLADIARVFETGEAIAKEVHFETPRALYTLEYTLSPLRASDGKVRFVVATGTDVTNRKRTEEALRRSEARWRAIAENPFDYVLVVEEDGTIQSINRALHGIDPADLIGRRRIQEFAVPEHRAAVEEALARVFETGQPDYVESYGRLEPAWYGSVFGAIQENGQVVAASVLARNITDAKRARAAKEEQRRFYHGILEQSLSPIVVYDTNSRISYANAESRRLALRPPEGAGQDEISSLWGEPSDAAGLPIPRGQQSLVRLALEGTATIGRLVRVRRSDENWLDFLVSCYALRDPDGAIVGAVASYPRRDPRARRPDRARALRRRRRHRRSARALRSRLSLRDRERRVCREARSAARGDHRSSDRRVPRAAGVRRDCPAPVRSLPGG